ncbi:magnesium and cobalt transport protein CorA [Motiliproteus coralliicola]|uniref:Magnesium transport protein CorA n=1 Tax=Motiliproteus coralliicola TaxID=2283196 RepID=A0A369WAL3_9GAMM|nr:magnesium/cobalt transporter CorA [Motiliproteus coralliicola]RDE18331.1 magnesium and cobalt transport protein CorA [Motiliproteus coralliicola]
MLRVFGIHNGRLAEQRAQENDEQTPRLGEGAWIDAHEPSDEERDRLEAFLRAELPESDDVEEIEASARYFIDHLGIHIHSLFLAQSEGRHQTVTTAFILQPDRLISIRDDDLADFRLLRLRTRAGQIEVNTPAELLVSLFDQKVENLADQLEDIHTDLETVSYSVLEEEDSALDDAIDQLAKTEDSNGKIRLCLMDTKRAVAYMMRQLRNAPDLQEQCREIMRDIDTLMSHNTFLFDKINFLMDSTQGFINIKQNQIIKIFSIAAVVFLPPTMIASIYGMNFQFMPELAWELGYPWALLLMVLAGIAPYLYFKRKGWL